MEFEAPLELMRLAKVEDFFARPDYIFASEVPSSRTNFGGASSLTYLPTYLPTPTYYLYDNNSAEFSFQFCNLDRPGDFRAPIIVGVPQHIFIQEHKAKKNQGSEK